MGNKLHKHSLLFSTYKIDYAGIRTDYSQLYPIEMGRIAEDDPFWKSKVKRGENATNDLYAWKNSASYTYSLLQAKALTGTYAGNVGFSTTSHPPPVSPSIVNASKLSQASSRAATCLRKKIQKESVAFSGATFLGELRETARMIKKPAEALADKLNDHARKLAKRKPKNPDKHWVNTVSDSWLEGMFGWAPLIGDISAIAEASLNKFEEPRIKRISCFAEHTESIHLNKNRVSGISGFQYYYEEESTSTRKVIYTVGYETQVDRSNNGLERVIVASNLGSWRDAVTAGYELLPWSFLVDYFSNIGDVINAAVVSMANVKWGYEITIDEHARTYKGITHKNLSPTSYATIQDNPGYSRATRKTVERKAALPPIPGVRFELPESNLKLANIAALLGGRL